MLNLNPIRMTPVHCFLPVEDTYATRLILGSMPGRESLRTGQYYAHPRNAFWSIMGELTGSSPALPYELRIQRLKSAGIALWDVLATCRRAGSLDADIDPSSIYANDFTSFFLSHPHITQVFFNGAMAEKYYCKQVLPTLTDRPLRYLRLPSTSPAHASLSAEQKLNIWKIITPNQSENDARSAENASSASGLL